MDIKNFPIYRRKGQHKVRLFYGEFTNQQKSQFGLTNQRNPCWLKHKPDPQTSWYLNKQMDQKQIRESKDTWKVAAVMS